MVVIAAESNEVIPVRAFHLTTSDGVYEPLTAIIQQPDKYTALLSSAKAELAAFERKYAALSELQPVFKAIKEIKED